MNCGFKTTSPPPIRYNSTTMVLSTLHEMIAAAKCRGKMNDVKLVAAAEAMDEEDEEDNEVET